MSDKRSKLTIFEELIREVQQAGLLSGALDGKYIRLSLDAEWFDDAREAVKDESEVHDEDEPQPEYCDCDGFHDGSCRSREIKKLQDMEELGESQGLLDSFVCLRPPPFGIQWSGKNKCLSN
jgi:hypothetical protein